MKVKVILFSAATILLFFLIILTVGFNKEDVVEETTFNGFHTEYLYPSTVAKLPKESYLRKEKLTIQTYENATVLPYQNIFSGQTKRGGVIAKDGEYIPTSKSCAHGGEKYKYDEKKVKYIDEDVFYLGIFQRHWGHFLMESIGRLWPIAGDPKKYKGMKIVCSVGTNKKEIDGPFLELFNLLGIEKDQFFIIEEPTRFKSVTIAEESFGLYRPFHTQEWKMLINALISSAMKHENKIKPHDKIFLSIHNFETNRRKRTFGADEIEDLFIANDYHSFAPEEFSLVEQIQTIYQAKQIAVVQGTIAHSLFFANPNSEVLIFNRSQHFDINQANITEATGKKSNTYFLDTWSVCGGMKYWGWGKGVYHVLIPNMLLLKWTKQHRFKKFPPICRMNIYEDFAFNYIPNIPTGDKNSWNQKDLTKEEFKDVQRFSYWPDVCLPKDKMDE